MTTSLLDLALWGVAIILAMLAVAAVWPAAVRQAGCSGARHRADASLRTRKLFWIAADHARERMGMAGRHRAGPIRAPQQPANAREE